MMKRFIHCHRSSIIIFIVLVGVAPIEPIINLLELRPAYTAPQFLLEPWRIFTGHIVHANWAHLIINVSNFVLLTIVFNKSVQKVKWLYFTFFSAFFISCGLWLTSPLVSYVGFSGVFHGLLFYTLLTALKNSNNKKTSTLFITTIAILVAKLIYEQVGGASNYLSLIINRSVAIDAHLFGAISGFIFWLFDKPTLHQS